MDRETEETEGEEREEGEGEPGSRAFVVVFVCGGGLNGEFEKGEEGICTLGERGGAFVRREGVEAVGMMGVGGIE